MSITILIPTNANLQVISSWDRKFLTEPREVWGITACAFKTTTILSVPQWIIRVENMGLETNVNSYSRLTVVVELLMTCQLPFLIFGGCVIWLIEPCSKTVSNFDRGTRLKICEW